MVPVARVVLVTPDAGVAETWATTTTEAINPTARARANSRRIAWTSCRTRWRAPPDRSQAGVAGEPLESCWNRPRRRAIFGDAGTARRVYRVAVEIGVLGPLLVTVGGRVVRVPAKQQTLLAVLALQPNAPVTADRLMTALWGEDVSPTALATLQSHVFQLRRALTAEQAQAGDVPDAGGPATIETEGRAYRLRIAPEAIDAQRFVGLLDEARALTSEEPRTALDRLSGALALWRRPGAPDVGEEPTARAEVERLAELRNGAVDDLVALRLRLGEAASVIPV